MGDRADVGDRLSLSWSPRSHFVIAGNFAEYPGREDVDVSRDLTELPRFTSNLTLESLRSLWFSLSIPIGCPLTSSTTVDSATGESSGTAASGPSSCLDSSDPSSLEPGVP